MKTISITLFGTVQGVGFRYFVKRHAKRLGVSGWVQNNEDGSVSVIAQAENKQLDDFVSLVKQGPLGSEVKDYISEEITKQELLDFTIRR